MTTSNHDDAELADALADSPLTPEEQHAEQTSIETAKKYSPSQVPYVNDQYTWAERQLELELMENLLALRLSGVRDELGYVRDINRSRTYPNIAFQPSATKE
jgi:hypothetical protein